MKKSIISLLVLLVVLLSACVAPTVSKNVFLDAEIHTEAVMNGSNTNKIGDRAYISVSKEDAKNASMDEYIE